GPLPDEPDGLLERRHPGIVAGPLRVRLPSAPQPDRALLPEAPRTESSSYRMWTFVRFELRDPGDYAAAFGLLAGAGFRLERIPAPVAAGPLPAAVALDRLAETAEVT